MKKILALALSAAMTLGMMSGCGNTTPASSAAPADSTAAASSTAPAEKTKLVLWHYFELGGQKEAITYMVDEFNKSQDKIEISDQYIPWGDLNKQISVSYAGNNMPDLAIIDNPNVAAFAKMGALADVTEGLKDWADKSQYFEGPLNSTMLDGKNYGIPYVSNCLALFYNKTMLDAASVTPPETWDQLRDAAKKLTKDGVYGFAMSANKGGESGFHMLPFIQSAGGSFDKLDSPESIKAVSFIRDMVNDGSMSKEVINLSQSDENKQFMAGKVAMQINGSWQIPDIQKNVDFEWGVVKMPKDVQFSSGLGGEDLCVMNTKNADAAVEFLKFVGTADVVRKYSELYGAFPPRKDVASDKYWTEDPILKIFMDQLQYAQARGPHPKWPEIETVISNYVQESLTNTKPVEVSAKDAQVALDEILK